MMITIFTFLSTPDNNPSQSDKNGGQFRNEMIKSQLAEMLVTIFVSFYNHLEPCYTCIYFALGLIFRDVGVSAGTGSGEAVSSRQLVVHSITHL